VLINTKLFTLKLASACILIEYLLLNRLYNNIKCKPPISYFKLTLERLTPNLPRKESLPRRPRFSTKTHLL
jgi:hypothetical protein